VPRALDHNALHAPALHVHALRERHGYYTRGKSGVCELR